MQSVEITLTVRRHEDDGSYTEWETKTELSAFTAKLKREIEKLLGAK
jgi:hypothetical protein